MLTDASSMAQWWENLLWATGGKLEVPKCFIYVLHWNFDSKGTAFLSTASDLLQHDLSIAITESETSQPAPIALLDCATHSCTLGVHIVPAGNSSPEASRLLDKSRSLGIRLKTSALRPLEGFAFYHSIYRPSLFYTLPINLTVKEGDTILKASTSSLLNACSFHCHFPRALTFVTKQCGGLEFSHIYDEQGCQHICTILLPHLCARFGQVHNFLCILYRWAHLVCGFPEPPFQNIDIHTPHLPTGWIASTRKYLRYTGTSIYISPSVCTPLSARRSGNHFLMADACASALSNSTCAINLCCIYLQVECSDLCNPEGTSLALTSSRFGPTTYPLSRSTQLWPKQGCPGDPQWITFTRFIRQTYCRTVHTNILKTPLGPWHPTHVARQWPCYHDPTTNTFMVQHAGQLPLYSCYPTSNNTTSPLPSINEAMQILPSWIPTSGNTPSMCPSHLPSTPPALVPFFQLHIAFLPLLQKMMLCKVHAPISYSTFLSLLGTHNGPKGLYHVCDGGAFDHLGSFGWVIGNNHEILVDNHTSHAIFPGEILQHALLAMVLHPSARSLPLVI